MIERAERLLAGLALRKQRDEGSRSGGGIVIGKVYQGNRAELVAKDGINDIRDPAECGISVAHAPLGDGTTKEFVAFRKVCELQGKTKRLGWFGTDQIPGIGACGR